MVSDKTRREAFITQNLGLVHACAGRFRGRGIEYDDLYGAGCMGLVKACDNFDPERGVCFSTYAVPVILGEIKKLFREGGTVKVSRSLKELGMRVQAAREHTMKLCGTEPTLSQLAEQLGESEFEPMFTACEGRLSGKNIALFGSTAGRTANGCAAGRPAATTTAPICPVRA